MHRFEETRHVAGRSPDEVFAYLTDPDKGAEWVSAAASVRAEGEAGVGRVLRTEVTFAGVNLDTEATVTAYEPPTHYAWAGGPPVENEFDFVLSEEDGGTRIEARVGVEPTGPFRLGARMIAKQFAKQFRGDLDRLVANVENGAAPPA